jgi:hypothetical protein
MTAYHSKRGPVEGCSQPDEPIREMAWTEGQKADMHREAFEREARDFGMSTKSNGTNNPVYSESRTALAWCFWQAAMRYRDEQEKQA